MRRIRKHLLWAWHLALLQNLKRYWKISSQAFWWLSQYCWNPLGAGRTCHGWRSHGGLHSHVGISLFLWAKLGASFLIQTMRPIERSPQDYIHSKPGQLNLFFEVCRKRHFTSLGGVFKCLTFFSDGKRQLFIFKEGTFNLTVHYLEKYSSIVQQMAYRGMFTSLQVQILKVHV